NNPDPFLAGESGSEMPISTTRQTVRPDFSYGKTGWQKISHGGLPKTKRFPDGRRKDKPMP
ncbi:MAG: hypothetical protein ACXWTN_11360, partial [Methylosarcina sp.]